MDMKRVLIVENNRIFRQFYLEWMEELGYEAHAYDNANLAWREYASTHILDYVILDLSENVDVVREGTPFSESIRAKNSEVKIIGLTAHIMDYNYRMNGVGPFMDEAMDRGRFSKDLVRELIEGEE
jgi:CheY-like chemotaxis protein